MVATPPCGQRGWGGIDTFVSSVRFFPEPVLPVMSMAGGVCLYLDANGLT